MTKRKIVTFFIVAIGIPLLIDWMIFANRFPSSISNEAWAGFLGSYIGGLCTMVAVFITIEDNNKKISEQRRTQEIQEKEQRRLNIRPYLDTRYKYFLKGSNTFEKDHTLFYQFSNKGKKFSVNYEYNSENQILTAVILKKIE